MLGEDDEGGVKDQYVQCKKSEQGWAGIPIPVPSWEWNPLIPVPEMWKWIFSFPSRSWTLGLELTIPIPVPKLKKSFPLNPDSEADDNVIKWELEDGCSYQKSLH